MKACLGWAVFLIGLTIYILYDVLYNSELQWRIFFERLPWFLLFGAALIAVLLIMKKKGALKNKGKKSETTSGSGDEKSGCDGDLNAPLREEEKNSNEKNDHHTDGNGEK